MFHFFNIFFVENEATFETISIGSSKQTYLKKYNVTDYYIWLKKMQLHFIIFLV